MMLKTPFTLTDLQPVIIHRYSDDVGDNRVRAEKGSFSIDLNDTKGMTDAEVTQRLHNLETAIVAMTKR